MIRITDPDQITTALEAMRTSRGLRRRALAERADMNETQYGPYENGRKTPALETLIRLAAAAEYDVVLMPREFTAGLVELAHAIPAGALAALAVLAAIPREDA